MQPDAARAALSGLDPRAAPETLASSRAPLLVGVRHHSPALAAAMPKILAAFAPTVVLIELPHDLAPWLPWLGSPELVAPVALSATSPDGALAFYPFADFSPELAAIRWARAAGVRVDAIDRPVSSKPLPDAEPGAAPRAGRLLARLEGGDDTGELWDTLVEARAPGDPEQLRRAALAFGWLMRADSLHGGGIPPEDAAREAHMRSHVYRALATPGSRVCAVVGAFHANALIEAPIVELAPPLIEPLDIEAASATTFGALVPYDFALLDARSGYPAGIRDPTLMQRAFELFSEGRALDAVIAELLVEIARELRARGHVASFADVREATRMAGDLAAIRGLASPGRRELLDAIESTMTQGEPLGRGRIVARALEVVLVGQRRGRVPDDAPRAGLAVSVNALLDELKLPGAAAAASHEAKEMTLDPERSPLDRRRAVALARLEICGIPYAEKRVRGVSGARGDVDNLTRRVALRYTPETAARLELAGIFGTTLPAAAEGTLRRGFAPLVTEEAGLARVWLEHVEQASAAGLPGLVHELLDRAGDVFLPAASLTELARAFALVVRIERGHVAGLPRERAVLRGGGVMDDVVVFERSLVREQEQVLFAALRTLEGIAGSTDEGDVRAFVELLSLFERQDLASLHHAVTTFARAGSPMMRGAGLAARMLLGLEEPARFFTSFVSLFDQGGDDPAASTARTATLRGALLVGGPTFEAYPAFVSEILQGIDRLDDARFLLRLPSLRGGFDVLSAADRQRMLDVIGAPASALELPTRPEMLAACARADQAGLAALARFGLMSPLPAKLSSAASAEPPSGFRADHAISLADRLRLVLGREPSKLGHGSLRFARALDELYGGGHGEGSRGGDGGGQGASYPTAREWGDELRELFGEEVREEVLGHAASGGHGAALALLDPEHVTPSIELLEQVLSLKGGLAERDFDHLRRLAKRIVDALVRVLAMETKAALSGLATPRASRRRSGPLDLRRTILRNLDTATVEPATLGSDASTERVFRISPRSFTFRARARKSLDWRVVLVVDVSGSMEASVLHSAMMAGILGSLPAVSTHFLAVNDRVTDLSSHAADPLELLLSVNIGGGTRLSRGLRYARSLLTVPARSIVILVSDFEEGGSVGELIGEVMALKESGARLLGLAALGEGKAPRYHRGIAERVVAAGMPVAALSPLELARWVGEKIRGGGA